MGCMGEHGLHVLADLWGCRRIQDAEEWTAVLRGAVDAMGATLVRLHVETFDPQGVTAFAVLAESHLSIHTWPERDYIAIDFYTCGATSRPEAGIESLKLALQPEQCSVTRIERGNRSGMYTGDSPAELERT